MWPFYPPKHDAKLNEISNASATSVERPLVVWNMFYTIGLVVVGSDAILVRYFRNSDPRTMAFVLWFQWPRALIDASIEPSPSQESTANAEKEFLSVVDRQPIRFMLHWNPFRQSVVLILWLFCVILIFAGKSSVVRLTHVRCSWYLFRMHGCETMRTLHFNLTRRISILEVATYKGMRAKIHFFTKSVGKIIVFWSRFAENSIQHTWNSVAQTRFENPNANSPWNHIRSEHFWSMSS